MPIKFTDEELQNKLTADQYRILRQKGTEAPFSGKYLNHKANGMYTCAACGAKIFSSRTKFESGSGWPSFYNPADSKAVRLLPDSSHGINRVEVQCANCGSHLGHVFDDAPDQPTGTRYCINSASLSFQPQTKQNES